MSKVEVTLVKSLIGRRPSQIATAQALGLKRIGSKVVKETNDAILGQIKTIAHLISVKELGE
ncbi:MAG: 50S ribosomal protein L30 [Acholeplasmatales bacterium]|jgi:large subunit ribosomal protein L30|nr:50S ribosomal protein L30 [Acholeplasmatales bacterium]